MANTGKFGGTYLNYREEVRDLLVKQDAYVSPEWFKGQGARIVAAYDLGEPVSVIADTLALFGRYAKVGTTKTPRQLAKRVVRCGPIEAIRRDLKEITERV